MNQNYFNYEPPDSIYRIHKTHVQMPIIKITTQLVYCTVSNKSFLLQEKSNGVMSDKTPSIYDVMEITFLW